MDSSFGARTKPEIDSPNFEPRPDISEEPVLTLDPEDLVNKLPTYDARRAMLARDALASVD